MGKEHKYGCVFDYNGPNVRESYGKCYTTWKNMFERNKSSYFVDRGLCKRVATIHPDFNSYNRFKEWYLEQTIDHNSRSALSFLFYDPCNWVIGPDTARIIPLSTDKFLRIFIVGHIKKNSDLPMGVALARTQKISYQAVIGDTYNKKHICGFKTPVEAYWRYCAFRKERLHSIFRHYEGEKAQRALKLHIAYVDLMFDQYKEYFYGEEGPHIQDSTGRQP